MVWCGGVWCGVWCVPSREVKVAVLNYLCKCHLYMYTLEVIIVPLMGIAMSHDDHVGVRVMMIM